MPQETKSMPAAPDGSATSPAIHDAQPAHAAPKLEGWIPPLASDQEIRHALEQAFDYRGDVTITLKDSTRIEGYIFDRRCDGPALSQCMVRLFPRDQAQKLLVRYDQIARLEFTGRDTAAGKSFETWLRKYQQKKAAGEKNIGIEPEPLE